MKQKDNDKNIKICANIQFIEFLILFKTVFIMLTKYTFISKIIRKDKAVNNA